MYRPSIPIKIQRLSDWTNKQKSTTVLYNKHILNIDTDSSKQRMGKRYTM